MSSSSRKSATGMGSIKPEIGSRQTINVAGKRFVLVQEKAFRRLVRQAGRRTAATELPPMPEPDEEGNRPALEYIRASIARDIIRERKALGLTQGRLAELAGIQQETLCRLESGKHSPTVLARVVEAWPALPEHIRRAVLALVGTA